MAPDDKPAPGSADDKPAPGSVDGCSDDECCVSPCDPPWLAEDQCFITYDSRLLRRPIGIDQAAPPALLDRAQPMFEFRVTFEHRICRRGKQHGPLVYTVTLLPGERVNLYHSDRYRRITSEQDRFSVATTFMQFTSAIQQARATGSFASVTDHLSSVKSGGSASFGGGLAGLLGAPGGTVSTSSSSTDSNQVSVGFVSDQFNQSVHQASLLTHAERSVVVSTFEDKETADVTVRTISNDNECRAVTYFVRQIVELFSVSTTVYDITYRIVAAGVPAEWHALDDVEGLPSGVVDALKRARELLPKVGDTVDRPRMVTIPTDGTVYDPELAKCCSCEPERAHRIGLKDQLLELEIERRKLLLASGNLSPFEPAPAAAEPAPVPTP